MKMKSHSERLDDMANFVRNSEEAAPHLSFVEKMGVSLMLLAYIWFVED